MGGRRPSFGQWSIGLSIPAQHPADTRAGSAQRPTCVLQCAWLLRDVHDNIPGGRNSHIDSMIATKTKKLPWSWWQNPQLTRGARPGPVEAKKWSKIVGLPPEYRSNVCRYPIDLRATCLRALRPQNSPLENRWIKNRFRCPANVGRSLLKNRGGARSDRADTGRLARESAPF